MKLKRILALILSLAMVLGTMVFTVSAADEVSIDTWSGEIDTTWYNVNGTEFTLTTAEQLAGFAELVNGGNTFENVTILLGADFDLEAYDDNGEKVSFPHIGGYIDSTYLPFKGTFDGNGHIISNLYQSGWAYGYDLYNYGQLGLFGHVENATIKNINLVGCESLVEGGDVGAVAGCAKGTCRFENITISDCDVATYNNACGGIVGWCDAGSYTFSNISLDEDTELTGLWGSFDSSIGGVVAQIDTDATAVFKDVKVACRLNCFNDVTASYKWYSYRMCGMLIGRLETLIEGTTEVDPHANGIICENVEITIGDWANYTYCWDDSLNRGCQRVEPGYSYGGINVEDYPNATIETIGFRTIIGGPQSQSKGFYGSDISKLQALEDFDTETLNVELAFPDGTVTYGYTRQDGVWGEAKSNSKESFYIELYAGDEKIATTTLNNVDGIIDGDVYVTWSVPFAGSVDEYWTVNWEDGHPTSKVQPTKAVLYADGIMVAQNDVQMNAPDNLNPVVWEELEALNLSGEGTADEPYLINSLEELKIFRNNVNAGETYKGKIVKLTADIDLNNEEWKPIGNSSNKFCGTFDGDNHTISNLSITGNNSNVGLFGFTTDGEVKNLTVKDAKVSGRLNVGVVAGTPYTSKYTNINVTGHVEVNGMSYVGAVGGKNVYADWTNVKVDVDDASYVKANSVEDGKAYRTYVGGVIGFMGEGGHTVSNVTSNINVYGSTCDVGGITGIAHYGNNFINCLATGDVYLEKEDAEVGGIAGVWHNGGSPVLFENCSFTGTVYVEGKAVRARISGTSYSDDGNGDITITGKVKLNGVEKENLAAALAEAKGMTEPAEIDLMGNEATIDKAQVLNSDVIFKNGTLNFDNYNGLDPDTYDPSGINYAVMTIGGNVTFDNCLLTGKIVTAHTGIFVLNTNGVMSLINGSQLDVIKPAATAVIYSEAGYDGKLVVHDSKISIDGKNNAVRGMLALTLDADNAEIFVKNVADNAMRNVKGTVANSAIAIDGAEYGIKNKDFNETLSVTNSSITVTNTANEDGDAGIYLTMRENLADENSIINAKIYVNDGENSANYYTLSFETNGGSIIPSVTDKEENYVVNLAEYTPQREGYKFGGWYSDEELTQRISSVTLDDAKTVYAKWNKNSLFGGLSAARETYTVSFETNGGSAVADVSKAENTIIDLSKYTTAKEGYAFAGWYSDSSFTSKLTSVKLAGNITVYAKWTEIDVDEDGWENPFTDVNRNAWYYDSVKYVVEKKLMNGVSEDKFAPGDTLTRAMLVTVLYRLSGEPAVNSSNPFADVCEDAYYASAVSWARENGIVNGVTDTEFAPDADITREQIAAIMYRYAQYKGYDVSAGEKTEILAYDDAESVSEYAVAAMQYVVGSGLIKGKTASTLNPQDNATRAEIATILQRFIEMNKI